MQGQEYNIMMIAESAEVTCNTTVYKKNSSIQ